MIGEGNRFAALDQGRHTAAQWRGAGPGFRFRSGGPVPIIIHRLQAFTHLPLCRYRGTADLASVAS